MNPLEQEGNRGSWLFHLCGFLALEAVYELVEITKDL